MTDEQRARDVDELTSMLIRIRPARAQLDSRVVFYEAGFQACMSARPANRKPSLAMVAAAVLIVVTITTAAGYRLGNFRARRAIATQQQDNDPPRAAVSGGDEHDHRVADSGAAKEKETVSAAPGIGINSSQMEVSSVAASRQPEAAGAIAWWKNPWQTFTQSAQLRRGGAKTLSAFDSTLVAQQRFDGEREDQSRTDLLDGYRSPFTTDSRLQPSAGAPLAVGDLQQFTTQRKQGIR